MAKKRPHPRHPKEHDILKAIKRTPAVVGGELADESGRPLRKRRAARKKG